MIRGRDKLGILINGMRAAVTGQLKGAWMFEILEIIGNTFRIFGLGS